MSGGEFAAKAAHLAGWAVKSYAHAAERTAGIAREASGTHGRDPGARRLEAGRPVSETRFHVEGIPAPQGSKRHVGHGRMVESSTALKPWRERVAWTAREHQVPLRTGAVVVHLAFVMPRPVSTPKRRTPPAMRKPDLDKLVRGVFDALSGLCFEDDARVVDLRATKRLAALGEKPGLDVVIKDLPEELQG